MLLCNSSFYCCRGKWNLDIFLSFFHLKNKLFGRYFSKGYLLNDMVTNIWFGDCCNLAFFKQLISLAAKDFNIAQRKVADILKGRILVGHALRNDLKASTNALYFCLRQFYTSYDSIIEKFVDFCLGFAFNTSKERYTGYSRVSTLPKV